MKSGDPEVAAEYIPTVKKARAVQKKAVTTNTR
jgi:hypothetical protein